MQTTFLSCRDFSKDRYLTGKKVIYVVCNKSMYQSVTKSMWHSVTYLCNNWWHICINQWKNLCTNPNYYLLRDQSVSLFIYFHTLVNKYSRFFLYIWKQLWHQSIMILGCNLYSVLIDKWILQISNIVWSNQVYSLY